MNNSTKSLEGIEIAIASGHPPDGRAGSGVNGEKAWNDILVDHMLSQLLAKGADVYVHVHTISSYMARQKAYAEAVRSVLPKCKAVFEFHYNAFNGVAKGHEFLYAYTPELARAIQRRFSESFPNSVARSGGIKQRVSGNGSGFLKLAPAAAVLTEPFFGDNPKEVAVFGYAQAKVAAAYIAGLEDYLGVDSKPFPTHLAKLSRGLS